ncbi:uncharacterized protein LOC132559985 isoform X2 [Ylistrum balloti]|uniref:uncharacterized protein LOC132559985 isoform X2 n=1 Tax=Ylistrum balloti TaxID=509963 RepID=UPI002905C3B7|nr:uncharacterized protein LOC132559985 isoform X2 [Ylistrum balloti]
MPIAHKDAEKIRAHMDYIIDNFDVTEFQSKLVGQGLKLPDVDVLNREKVIREKNRKCLKYLINSENADYQVLIDLLRRHNYTEVVAKLESGLQPEKATCKGSTVPSIHVPENKRHICLTEKHLVRLFKPVSVKDKLAWATCLGVPQREVEAIEMDNRFSTDTQMFKILICWRKRPDCTLGVLMDLYNYSVENGVEIDTEALQGIIDNIR